VPGAGASQRRQPALAPNRSPAPTAPRPAATTPQPAVQGFTGSGTPASAGDPDYGTCKNAKAHGGGPYYEGKDPEYHYYQDRDHDGIVCE
jgi:micrococcal nuclease